MRPEDIAYAAGLFDGEGCIHIARIKSQGRPCYTLHAKVAMTDPVCIKWLHTTFGGGLSRHLDARNIRRPLHTWQLYGHKAAAWLSLLLPHLQVKKTQAITALEFSQTLSPRDGTPPNTHRRSDAVVEHQREFYEEMKRLKTLIVGANGDIECLATLHEISKNGEV